MGVVVGVVVLVVSSVVRSQEIGEGGGLRSEPSLASEGQEAKLDVQKMEQELTKYHLEFSRLRMKEENMMSSGGKTSQELFKIKQKQTEIVEKVIYEYNLNKYAKKFAKIIDKFGQQKGTSLILRKFSSVFIALRDFYFEYG